MDDKNVVLHKEPHWEGQYKLCAGAVKEGRIKDSVGSVLQDMFMDDYSSHPLQIYENQQQLHTSKLI